MISISINKYVPAFHLPVYMLSASKILLSFDTRDCFNVLCDEVMRQGSQRDIDKLIEVGAYNPRVEHMLILNMRDYFANEVERLKIVIENTVKIEELDQASIESIERFANKVGCFIDVEFRVNNPASWFGWLYTKILGRYDHKISTCYLDIPNKQVRDIIFPIIEESYNTQQGHHIVAFSKVDSDDATLLNIVSNAGIAHKIFGHALGLKHSEDDRYESYMKDFPTDERLKDCHREVVALNMPEGSEVQAVLECAGMVSDVTPVDLNGLRELWGRRNVENNTFCYYEIEALQQKYPYSVKIINVDI